MGRFHKYGDKILIKYSLLSLYRVLVDQNDCSPSVHKMLNKTYFLYCIRVKSVIDQFFDPKPLSSMWMIIKQLWKISQTRIVSKVYVVFFCVFKLRFRLRLFYFNLNLKKQSRGFSVELADSCYIVSSGEKHPHKLIVTVSPDRLTLRSGSARSSHFLERNFIVCKADCTTGSFRC